MISKKRKDKPFDSGMKPVRGGYEIFSLSDVRGGGCICSPGGHEYGQTDPCGCACGCFGPSTPQANRQANDDSGDPEIEKPI